jgi:hypothetical protein
MGVTEPYTPILYASNSRLYICIYIGVELEVWVLSHLIITVSPLACFLFGDTIINAAILN